MGMTIHPCLHFSNKIKKTEVWVRAQKGVNPVFPVPSEIFQESRALPTELPRPFPGGKGDLFGGEEIHLVE